MRRITTWLALSTFILALTSAYLYSQLTAAKVRARHDAASEAELRNQIAKLERTRAGLETVSLPVNAGPPPAAAPPLSPSTESEGPAASRRQPPEMPAELRLMVTYRIYRGLFRDLALSEAEVAAVLPVLVQQELRRNPYRMGPPGARSRNPQRDHSEVAAVLGAEKAERFSELRRLQPLRSEVSTLGRRLEGTAEPLSPEQQETLLGILASRPEPASPGGESDDPQPSPDQWAARMREREQRLREDAEPVLTAAQRQLLKEDDAFQSAMRAHLAASFPQAGSSAPIPSTVFFDSDRLPARPLPAKP